MIESESANAGIPYADAFSVKCHYCLSKLSPTEANIIVISKIYYKKSIWAAKRKQLLQIHDNVTRFTEVTS